MSKSYVHMAPELLRPQLQDALEKLNAFGERYEAEMQAILVKRGRSSVLGRLAKLFRRPFTDDQAVKEAMDNHLWWLGLPEDHGYVNDRRIIKRLLAASKADGGIVVQVHVDELDIVNWWRKFEVK